MEEVEENIFGEYKIYFIAAAIIVILLLIYFSWPKEKMSVKKNDLEAQLDNLIDKINIKQEE